MEMGPHKDREKLTRVGTEPTTFGSRIKEGFKTEQARFRCEGYVNTPLNIQRRRSRAMKREGGGGGGGVKCRLQVTILTTETQTFYKIANLRLKYYFLGLMLALVKVWVVSALVKQ